MWAASGFGVSVQETAQTTLRRNAHKADPNQDSEIEGKSYHVGPLFQQGCCLPQFFWCFLAGKASSLHGKKQGWGSAWHAVGLGEKIPPPWCTGVRIQAFATTYQQKFNDTINGGSKADQAGRGCHQPLGCVEVFVVRSNPRSHPPFLGTSLFQKQI